MGNINIGNQINTFRYEHPASSTEFNILLHKLISSGIYSGGLITKISDSIVSVEPTVVVISDPENKVTLRSETTESAEVSINSVNNYIVMRLDWIEQIGNYVDILGVSELDLLEKDVILAKANYNESVLVNFDYSVATKTILEQIQQSIVNEIYNREQADLTLQSNIDDKFDSSEMKNVGGIGSENKGVLTNSQGYIDKSFFTDLFFTNVFDVESLPQMLALPAERGDIARRTDENLSYVLNGDDPSVQVDWKKILVPVLSVSGKTGEVYLSKEDVGLDNADNTSDLDKPISTAVAEALLAKTTYDDLSLKLDKTNREDVNVTDLGTPAPGVSENVSRADHTHDVFLPISSEDISITCSIPLGSKKKYTILDNTEFTVNTTSFRADKENWFDIDIINSDLYLVSYPSEWKWINNVIPPIGEPFINLIGWSSDSTNWDVGYIVLGS